MTQGYDTTSFWGAMGMKTDNGALRARSERSITQAEGSPRAGHAKKSTQRVALPQKKEKKAARSAAGGIF